MTITVYGVCPNCNTIVSKKVTSGYSTEDKVSYVKGQRCSTACSGRKANQAPEVRREKK